MKFAHCQQYNYAGRRVCEGGGGGGGGADDKFVILLVKKGYGLVSAFSRIALGLRPRAIRLASRRYQAVSLFYK